MEWFPDCAYLGPSERLGEKGSMLEALPAITATLEKFCLQSLLYSCMYHTLCNLPTSANLQLDVRLCRFAVMSTVGLTEEFAVGLTDEFTVGFTVGSTLGFTVRFLVQVLGLAVLIQSKQISSVELTRIFQQRLRR